MVMRQEVVSDIYLARIRVVQVVRLQIGEFNEEPIGNTMHQTKIKIPGIV